MMVSHTQATKFTHQQACRVCHGHSQLSLFSPNCATRQIVVGIPEDGVRCRGVTRRTTGRGTIVL